jgi:CHASE1-domain containing sensor protein
MKLTRILDWIIIIIGLVSTGLVTLYVSQKNLKEDRLRFQYETNSLVRRIQNRMQNYEGALLQLRAVLRNAPDVGRENIQQYLRDSEIIQRFPGLQGIGYAQMVQPEELPAHLKMMKTILPEYKIFPEGKRDIYSSVILLIPEDRRNKKAIGYDMYSDPLRRRAMDEARDKKKFGHHVGSHDFSSGR